MDIDKAHPIHRFVPKRSIVACKLRPEFPSVSKAKIENELSIFHKHASKTMPQILRSKNEVLLAFKKKLFVHFFVRTAKMTQKAKC